MSKNPLKKKKISKAGLGVGIATAVFAIIATVFLIIGYQDTLLKWMRVSGIAMLVIAAFPIGWFIYHLIDKRIQP